MIRALILALIPSVVQANCSDVTYRDQSYTLCEVTLGEDVRMWSTDADGVVLGTFNAIRETLTDGETLIFAMNAGMYHPDRSPVGHYVENGTAVTPLVDGGGYGNFGLVPNGVFCVSDNGFDVIETNAFGVARPVCDYATQSGPMLVIDGALHPQFNAGSQSVHYRNGVGVSADGDRAVFAISNQPVNFHSFATLFRDGLDLPNALFLDGKVSRLYSAELGRYDVGFPLGPMVGLVVRQDQ